MLKRFWNWTFPVNDRKNIKKKDDSNTALFTVQRFKHIYEKDFKTSKKDALVKRSFVGYKQLNVNRCIHCAIDNDHNFVLDTSWKKMIKIIICFWLNSKSLLSITSIYFYSDFPNNNPLVPLGSSLTHRIYAQIVMKLPHLLYPMWKIIKNRSSHRFNFS